MQISQLAVCPGSHHGAAVRRKAGDEHFQVRVALDVNQPAFVGHQLRRETVIGGRDAGRSLGRGVDATRREGGSRGPQIELALLKQARVA